MYPPVRHSGCITLLLLTLFLNSACAVIDYQSSLRDKDNDGVTGEADECPESPPNAVVSERGCDLFNGVVNGLAFETGSLALTDAAQLALDELVAAMAAHPQVRLNVAAHTDNRGKASSNLALSKRRVMVVVEYLVEKGVGSARLLPIGYGESRPLAANETAAGRRLNRRVEVTAQ